MESYSILIEMLAIFLLDGCLPLSRHKLVCAEHFRHPIGKKETGVKIKQNVQKNEHKKRQNEDH